MDFPINIDAISMGLSIIRICTLRDHRLNCLNYDVFQTLTSVLILANSVDPDEKTASGCISSGSSLLQKSTHFGISRIQGANPLPHRDAF